MRCFRIPRTFRGLRLRLGPETPAQRLAACHRDLSARSIFVRTAGLKHRTPAPRSALGSRVRVPLAMESKSERRAEGRPDRRPAVRARGRLVGGTRLSAPIRLLVVEDADDPFALLDAAARDHRGAEGVTGGGWVGYLGYGLGRLVERLPPPPRRPVPVPRSMLAFYDHVLRCDDAGQWWFEALWSDEQSERLESRLASGSAARWSLTPDPGTFGCGPFLPSPEPETHLVSVSRAIEHIRSGDVFQVNVCTRLEAGFSGRPGRALLRRRRPSHAALWRLPRAPVGGGCQLLARAVPPASRPPRPELAHQGHGAGARVRPTTERERLLGSAKDRAENVMIVDLVRNDLGRVCRYGSVAVPELCRAEEHPGVWHLVSDVTGELSEGVSDADCCGPRSRQARSPGRPRSGRWSS